MRRKIGVFRLARERDFSEARWEGETKLHLTLLPPWEEFFPEEAVRTIKNFVWKGGRPEVSFSEVALGPNPVSPRLIWLKGEPNEALLEILDVLSRRLNIDFKRPFLAHITLARFSEKEEPIWRGPERVSWLTEFDRLALYESRLLPTGSVYKILAEIKLA